jgi:hypothetical protein
MVMEFERNGWPLAQPAGQGRGSADSLRLDWHGLLARLSAAHACRRALTVPENHADARGGSFDATAARALAVFGNGAFEYDERAVNPNISADGKHPAGISTDVADTPKSGDRG